MRENWDGIDFWENIVDWKLRRELRVSEIAVNLECDCSEQNRWKVEYFLFSKERPTSFDTQGMSRKTVIHELINEFPNEYNEFWIVFQNFWMKTKRIHWFAIVFSEHIYHPQKWI
jgi:hypothetical protein